MLDASHKKADQVHKAFNSVFGGSKRNRKISDSEKKGREPEVSKEERLNIERCALIENELRKYLGKEPKFLKRPTLEDTSSMMMMNKSKTKGKGKEFVKENAHVVSSSTAGPSEINHRQVVSDVQPHKENSSNGAGHNLNGQAIIDNVLKSSSRKSDEISESPPAQRSNLPEVLEEQFAPAEAPTTSPPRRRVSFHAGISAVPTLMKSRARAIDRDFAVDTGVLSISPSEAAENLVEKSNNPYRNGMHIRR